MLIANVDQCPRLARIVKSYFFQSNNGTSKNDQVSTTWMTMKFRGDKHSVNQHFCGAFDS